jgi:predicted PurR-regulated permease PerM
MQTAVVILSVITFVLVVICSIFWDINSEYREEKKRIIEQQDEELRILRLQDDIRHLKKEYESIRVKDANNYNQLLGEIQSVTNFIKENFVEKKKKTTK